MENHGEDINLLMNAVQKHKFSSYCDHDIQDNEKNEKQKLKKQNNQQKRNQENAVLDLVKKKYMGNIIQQVNYFTMIQE